MLSMLVAYDAEGNIVASLAHMVAKNELDEVIGLIDFDAHEKAGGEMTDVWKVDNAVGSKTWPEWIGTRSHDFKVELDGPPGRKRIKALVHKTSGFRREREAVEAAIAQRISAANGRPADIRDLVGGPDRPLQLDDQGRTIPSPSRKTPQLPTISLSKRSPSQSRQS